MEDTGASGSWEGRERFGTRAACRGDVRGDAPGGLQPGYVALRGLGGGSPAAPACEALG